MARNDGDRKSSGNDITDTIQLIKDYVRQETIGPLKGIGRFIAFGLAGTVLLGVGLILLLLAGLRALQTETGTNFTGNLSWIPYLFVLVAVVIVIGLAVSRISKTGLSRPEEGKR